MPPLFSLLSSQRAILICFLLVLLIGNRGFVFHLSAQNIHGTIKDRDGIPLPFVMVYKQKSTIGTITNHNGEYSLKSDHGKHIIEYRLIGYEPVFDTIVLSPGQSCKHNVTLHAKASLLQEVEIMETEDPAVTMIKKAIALKPKNRVRPPGRAI